MALSERKRQEMYAAFEKSVGKEPALTLMEHLPPVGWADVATRNDLEQLELRMNAKIDIAMADMRAYVKTQLMATVGMIVTIQLVILSVFKFVE